MQETTEHVVTSRKGARGPPMKIAQEDIIMIPKGELTLDPMKTDLNDDENN